MTQCWEEIRDLIGNRAGTVASPAYADLRFNADDNRWEAVKQIIGDQRVLLGPSASQQWLNAPEHLAMVLARYRAASALIGGAQSVLEVGCGEGIGAGILAKHREMYAGIDTDAAAITVANSMLPERPGVDRRRMSFVRADVLQLGPTDGVAEAVVALDVIEHIPTDREDDLMRQIATRLVGWGYGICVIGTPSKHAAHLASPQSQAGHVNLYTPERLRALMTRHFRVVQTLYMQDTAIHLGHPGMAHYILAVGIGPK